MANLAAENTQSNKSQTPSPATTKAAHTPGPWTQFDGGLDGFAIQAAGIRDRIAQTFYKSMKNGECEGFEAAKANAHLIAAAPEMLEALEELTGTVRDWLNVYNDKSAKWLIEKGSFKLAEAAIQKAKGIKEPTLADIMSAPGARTSGHDQR